MRSFILTVIVLLILGGVGGWYYSNKIRPAAEIGTKGVSPTVQPQSTLEASLEASGRTMTITKNANDVQDSDKVIISVTYTNHTDRDLSGIKVWLSVGALGTFDSPPSTTFNKQVTEISPSGISVFDTSDVSSGSSATARMAVFALKAGTYPVSATIKTEQGLEATTSAIVVVSK